MLDSIRQTIIASQAISFNNRKHAPLTYKEAFYLATVGGSQLLGLESLVGNFAVGKAFDAVLVDPFAEPIDVIGVTSLELLFEKFLFLGDDRNIVGVYVQGKKVLPKN